MDILYPVLFILTVLCVLRAVYLLEKMACMLFYLNDNLIAMHEEAMRVRLNNK